MTRGHQILLLILFSCLLFFGIRGSMALYHFTRLSSFTVAQEMKWEIEEREPSEVFVVGTYLFEFHGKKIQGKAALDPPFLNVYAAHEALTHYKEFTWQVWFNPSAPEETALQRIFPWKDISYGAVLGFLFVHFLFLGLFPRYKELTGMSSLKGRATAT